MNEVNRLKSLQDVIDGRRQGRTPGSSGSTDVHCRNRLRSFHRIQTHTFETILLPRKALPAKKSVFTPDLIGYGQYREQYGREWTLNDQANHLESWIRMRADGPVHLAGHSVGGAVAVLMAKHYPERILSLTLIEGNLTLRDAFWSQKIASQSLDEIQTEVDGFREDVTAWIARAGVKPTRFAIETATDWLDNQPVATFRAQARAVVSATRDESYLEGLRSIVSSGLPVHLLAGAHSRNEWNIPGWLEENATTNQVIPQAGHLMMIEQPEIFARTVTDNLTG